MALNKFLLNPSSHNNMDCVTIYFGGENPDACNLQGLDVLLLCETY